MVKPLVSLVLFLNISIIAFSQSWAQKSNFPGQSRYSASSFELNGFGFVGLGRSSSSYELDFYKYDPLNDTWSSTVTNFPGAGRASNVSFVIDSLAYVGLGWNGSATFSNFYSYNANSNSWLSNITAYPGTGGRNSMAASVNGKAYVVGGTVNSQIPYSSQLWEYDPVSNFWTQKANFPGGPRATGIMFGINGIIYCGLGHDSNNDFVDLWAYDPSNDMWTQKGNFPGLGRLGADVFVLNGKAIVGGGFRLSNSAKLNDFYEYDPVLNFWIPISTFGSGGRSNSASFTIGNKGYLSCGRDTNNIPLNDLWEYSNSTVSIEESNVRSFYTLSPNPSNGRMFLKLEAPLNVKSIMCIYNSIGEVVEKKEVLISNGNAEIDLGHITSGLYIYTLEYKAKSLSGKISIVN